jgi:hypothetical protein
MMAILLALLAQNVPTSQYETRTVAEWTVRVNKDLGDDGVKPLALLEEKLREIARIVPKGPLAELRKVPIWLGVNDYVEKRACYHPNAGWLKDHGLNVDKAKAVEIGCAAELLKMIRDQPMMILHELAHAYHDRVLSFEHAEIRAAFAKAKEAGLYESVLRCSGKREKAYAASNHHEYFAEASEAWFGQNDFYPFVRAELREHDPALFEILKNVWK